MAYNFAMFIVFLCSMISLTVPLWDVPITIGIGLIVVDAMHRIKGRAAPR